MDYPAVGGSVGGVRSIRVGGARVFGGIECADRRVCGKPCASSEAGQRASTGCDHDSGLVPCRSLGSGARQGAKRVVFSKVLALLAALVLASVFSFLFRGAGQTRASFDARVS